MKPRLSHYDSTDLYQSRLSEEERRLISEKETLTKAVEVLSRRRRAVAAARFKAEMEVHRQAQYPSFATDDVDHLAQAEQRLKAEHSALRLVIEDLAQRRAALETAGVATGAGSRIQAAAETPLPGSFRAAVPMPTERHAEPCRTPKDNLRIHEADMLKGQPEAPAQLTLEQRLRLEIEGLAAAQRKRIDAARAKLVERRSAAAPAPSGC